MGLFETSVESCLSRDSSKSAALPFSRTVPRPARSPPLLTSSTRTECSLMDPAQVLADKSTELKISTLRPSKLLSHFRHAPKSSGKLGKTRRFLRNGPNLDGLSVCK